MILSFLTQINGQPTNFIEKIWKGLKDEKYHPSIKWKNNEDQIRPFPVDINVYNKCLPKIHTIREDKANRWKQGVFIDFFVNARKKNMCRFVPNIQVASVQDIEIKFIDMLPFGWDVEIIIDGKLLSYNEEDELAKNDGFENFDKFSNYFLTKGENFKGKIIHWTNFKYKRKDE